MSYGNENIAVHESREEDKSDFSTEMKRLGDNERFEMILNRPSLKKKHNKMNNNNFLKYIGRRYNKKPTIRIGSKFSSSEKFEQ